MIPSQYIAVDSLGGTNCYFDTGVFPTNKTEIDGIFRANREYPTYVFGARNTNSSTSAGQFNLLISATSYIGFASARLSLGTEVQSGMFYIYNTANSFILNDGIEVYDRTGSTSTFTGTRSMYILAMNNAGNPNYGSDPTCRVYYFKIAQNGVVVKEYFPVYDTVTGQFGLFDTVNNEFITNQGTGSFTGHHLMTIQAGEGGQAYIEMPYGKVTQQYVMQGIYGRVHSPIKAVANEGYVFSNWTDANGNVISTNRELSISITVDQTFTANFVKEDDRVQKNPFKLLGLKYGVGAINSAGDPNGRDSDLYALIESFSIQEDALTRTTSTIVCREVPSNYQIDMPVIVFDDRGHILWIGLIKAIQENTLECRELLSLTDQDFVFTPTTSVGGFNLTNFVLLYAAFYYTSDFDVYSTSNKSIFGTAMGNAANKRKTATLFGGAIRRQNPFLYSREKNVFVTLPATSETEVGNLEDWFIELFNQFGVAVETSLEESSSVTYPEKGVKHLVSLTLTNPLIYDDLIIGDNVECISNVSVINEVQETTVLMIYNSAGSTLRGIYGMKTDGTIEQMEDSIMNFIGYTDCKTKVLLSDDKINTLVAQNLTNSLFNHKITFDIDLKNRFYELDDFKMGRRVNFYYGNKLYKSIVTGKEYSAEDGQIKTAKITLGNVRTSLTTKLNLGKVKKK